MRNLYDVDLMVKARIGASITQLSENLKLFNTLSYENKNLYEEIDKTFRSIIKELDETNKIYQSYRDSYFDDYSKVEEKLKSDIIKLNSLRKMIDNSRGSTSFDISLNEQILKEVDYVIDKLETAIEEVKELPALSKRVKKEDYNKIIAKFEKDEEISR